MKSLRINEKDNVAVALTPLKKGEAVNVSEEEILLAEDIPRGHKFTLVPLSKNSLIIKYGFPIGTLTENAGKGAWVHTHNLRTNLGKIEHYEYTPEDPVPERKIAGASRAAKSAEVVKASAAAGSVKTFRGYVRSDGKVGIRNEIWIVPTVGCVNSIARRLAEEASRNMPEGIDGIYAFEHPYGCSQMSEDQENTRKVLAGLMEHPNAAAVLAVGLGCENCSFESIAAKLTGTDAPTLTGTGVQEGRIAFMECQSVSDDIAYGKQLLNRLIKHAQQYKRTELPASELIVGLKCGGSDGLSGITANPLVGRFSDTLIAMGGSAVLTEVPEMFGAERLLMNRCEDRQTFDGMVSLINGYKDYYTKHQQVVYENPSPGNKAGGITTLEEKSLGCVQKGGGAVVRDVLEYGEKVRKNGLTVLSSPGNDLVASTALAVSGAHLILFTTGRGTPFGSPVPTIKISTNSEIFEKKPTWHDFNAGEILHGKIMELLEEELMELILQTASGRKTRSEVNGYRDFAIFKSGVTL